LDEASQSWKMNRHHFKHLETKTYKRKTPVKKKISHTLSVDLQQDWPFSSSACSSCLSASSSTCGCTLSPVTISHTGATPASLFSVFQKQLQEKNADIRVCKPLLWNTILQRLVIAHNFCQIQVQSQFVLLRATHSSNNSRFEVTIPCQKGLVDVTQQLEKNLPFLAVDSSSCSVEFCYPIRSLYFISDSSFKCDFFDLYLSNQYEKITLVLYKIENKKSVPMLTAHVSASQIK
jgi:hypothetical protein